MCSACAQPAEGGDAPRRRRPRYRGTHPRRFDEKYKELRPEAYPEMHEHVRDRGMTPAGTHIPALLDEVIAALQPAPGETVVDCTLGYGGHAAALLRRTAPDGLLVGLDVDLHELERTRERLLREFAPGRVHVHHGNYAGIAKALGKSGLDGCDMILADLGVSSMQIDDPARGFSYKHEGPLDMRMDPRLKRTAADLLMTLPEDELSNALSELADEPDHERIAAAVVRARRSQPIRTTQDLVRVILTAKGIDPRAHRRDPNELHPAALTFQALRILVNDELAALRELLRVAPYVLHPGGRIAIISFHSGEDRLVKRAFREGLASRASSAVCDDVIRAAPAERRSNPRSAPARLRWARRASEIPA